MNLTNISITPVHIAYDEVYKKANERGIRVSGSELVGLIPLQAMLDAGKYFLRMQNRSLGISEKELLKIAVKSMGLDELKPFKPEEKIIEYMIADKNRSRLVNMKLNDFADETASESPAPGGGSISAYVGSLGVSLGTMVANLSSHKRGWDDKWEFYSEWAEKGQKIKDELLFLVDEDTNAFNKIMEAFGLPKGSEEEKVARNKAIQEASRYAMEIPFRVMQKSLESMEIMEAMAKDGLEASVSDAGVGALCARTAVMGAFLNVKINASGVDDKDFVNDLLSKGQKIEEEARGLEKQIIKMVDDKISKQ
jgi:glutamate formiminotransferase/formiminotetrahydrofolate cyclodeaminase